MTKAEHDQAVQERLAQWQNWKNLIKWPSYRIEKESCGAGDVFWLRLLVKKPNGCWYVLDRQAYAWSPSRQELITQIYV